MPRGKYVRKNKRNESLLTTQLMRISLRMDDHIYNDQPISAADAASFLQEIAALKLHCLPTNARALQVIEKLTRLLRNILTEEGGLSHASCSVNKPVQINTEFARSASPVYSLPDEDRNDEYEQNVDFNKCIYDDHETIHKEINISHENVATKFSVHTDENKINYIHEQALAMNNLNTNHTPHYKISRKEIYTPRGQINLNTPMSYKQDITTSQAGNNAVYPKNNFNKGQVIDITNDSDIDEVNETVADSNKPNICIEHVNFGVSNMAIQNNVGKPTKLNHTPHYKISRKEIYTPRGQINLNTPTSYKQDITTSQAGNNTVYPQNNFNKGQIIDITNDSDIDEANETVADSKKSNICIEHVNFGVSNMAIQDNVGKPTKLVNDDVNCSQSILENCAKDSENEADANKKDRAVENKSYNEKNAKACVINKVNNYFQKQASLAVMPTQDVLTPAISQHTQHTFVDSGQQTLVDFNKYNKPSTQKATLVENKMEMKKKAENDTDQPKKRRTKKNLKPTDNKTAHKRVRDDLNATTDYKYVTNKSNNIKVCDPKTVKKSRKLKKVHDIYNENVENDLSWVENLRYVREISPSEYDPALSMLQDDFWDNFNLPDTWKDLDFEV